MPKCLLYSVRGYKDGIYWNNEGDHENVMKTRSGRTISTVPAVPSGIQKPSRALPTPVDWYKEINKKVIRYRDISYLSIMTRCRLEACQVPVHLLGDPSKSEECMEDSPFNYDKSRWNYDPPPVSDLVSKSKVTDINTTKVTEMTSSLPASDCTSLNSVSDWLIYSQATDDSAVYLSDTSDATDKQQTSSSSDKPQAGSTGKPQAGSSDKPHSESSDKPQAGSTDKPQAGSTDKPQAGSTDKPLAGSSDKPQAGSTDKPLAGSSDKPQAGSSSDKPLAGSSDKPLAASSDKPLAGSSDKPLVGSTAKRFKLKIRLKEKKSKGNREVPQCVDECLVRNGSSVTGRHLPYPSLPVIRSLLQRQLPVVMTTTPNVALPPRFVNLTPLVLATSSAVLPTSSAVLPTSSAVLTTSSTVLATSSAFLTTSSTVLATSSAEVVPVASDSRSYPGSSSPCSSQSSMDSRSSTEEFYEALQRLERDVHIVTVDSTGNQIHRCKACNRVFSVLTAFKSHVRSHTRQSTQCHICGKVFSRTWLLKGHLRVHTGERPYKCIEPGCGRAFADKSNLRSHSLTHTVSSHSYECNKCHRKFAQKRYLHKHQHEVCLVNKLSRL